MSDAREIVCPGCSTLQQSDSPFCENCGYRLGRPETAQEGHRAIIPKPRTSAVDTDMEVPAVGVVPPADRADVATAIEGVPAISASMAKRSKSTAVNAESTAVEGLPPVESPKLSAPQTQAELLAITVDDEAPVAPAPSPPAARGIWIVLWLVSIGAAVAVTTLLQTEESAEEPVSSPSVAPAQSRVVVGAGTFKRGLNERVRSFVLTTCLKMSDDKSICDQDTLLAGEFPEEEASVDKFLIDRREVTIGDLEQCTTAGGCAAIDWKACKVYTHQGLQISLRVPKTHHDTHVAATCVSRSEAAAYCAWRSGRLPTHDEWERAARGTDGRVFPWGSIWDPTVANWGEIDVARVHVTGKIDGFEWVAVPGQFPGGQSPTTALDMAGNVSEWVGDEPVAARGGSWTSTPFDLRVTNRLELDPDVRRTDVGFRCAYDK